MRRTKPPVGWEHVKNCFPVPNELLEFDLPGGAIAVYVYLLRHADRRTGQCHPSTATIAKKLHYCRNTVATYVRLLEDRGLIVTENTKIITGASRKTATCSTPSSPCMKSHRRTTTGNSQKQTSPPRNRKRKPKPKSWASSSSRQAMGKAHERPVFAPVGRCVRPDRAGWGPAPARGLGAVLPPFGRGCEDERKSGIKLWRRFRRYGRPQLPAVRAVYGGFTKPYRCMYSGVCFRGFVHEWRLPSPNRRWLQALRRHLI